MLIIFHNAFEHFQYENLSKKDSEKLNDLLIYKQN